MTIRVAYWGTPPPAVPPLESLVNDRGVEVVAVVTNPDRPAGRGQKLRPPAVKVAAAAAGLPVWQPARPREVVDDLAALRVDACAVVAYGAILSPEVLQAGGRGFVNLHFSLLPAWRGAAPVPHAILEGDASTGVTCFVLDEGMDTGPILLAADTGIGPEETAGELTARLAELGAPLLVDAVRGFAQGTLTPVPQPGEGATYAPKLTAEDARLDFSRPAEVVQRAVRAFNPVPGAHTHFEDLRLKVHRVRRADGTGPSGSVLRLDADGPVVACGTGALCLVEVQPAGRPRMSGVAFANGHHPVGRRLGAAGRAGEGAARAR